MNHILHERLDNSEKLEDIKAGLKSMDELLHIEYRLIECVVKKSWIKTVGLDGGDAQVETIVTTKAIFPNPKDYK